METGFSEQGLGLRRVQGLGFGLPRLSGPRVGFFGVPGLGLSKGCSAWGSKLESF